MSNEIPYLEQLRQAVAASGEPDTATISRLVDAVFAQPDNPPDDSRLWPIHSFVRACVQGGMPRECLGPEFLAQVSSAPVIKNASTHPEASLPERFAAINEHIANVHAICPLGVSAARREGIHYWGLPKGKSGEPEEYRRHLRSELRRFFAGSKRVLILAFGDNFDTHEAAHQAGKSLFYELNVASASFAYPWRSECEIVDMLDDRRLVAVVSDPGGRIKEPMVEFRNRGKDATNDFLFAFAANNLYHPEHPRYLPFPGIVVNYNEDLAASLRSDVALSAKISINAAAGLACPFIRDVSVEELRKGGSAKYVVLPNGTRGFATAPHPAITPRMAMAMAAFYKKLFYEFPIPEELMRG